MKILQPYVEILDEFSHEDILKKIESAGRVCYKSETLGFDKEKAERFISARIKQGHESIIEHVTITVRIICDRGVSHELVRHRIASYSQESTRYCNYEGDIIVIDPCDAFGWFRDGKEFDIWKKAMKMAENNYNMMLAAGCKPEEARSVLPNSLKTEVVCTMNLREWRHFLKLRCDKAAHPQMREIAKMILAIFYTRMPVFFYDIANDVYKKWAQKVNYEIIKRMQDEGLANFQIAEKLGVSEVIISRTIRKGEGSK